ncbi:hypothetical protein CIPAW_03G100600 [Carya illinoinensis]|uniref:Uncharacterized protein n=1 Tax=Carya illinoinensis TaxID=32201 RepID=A0A8T1R2N7_CARIL|nr:hypothetical protein CIPAW_03G100600 [Carya illinoinensis]
MFPQPHSISSSNFFSTPSPHISPYLHLITPRHKASGCRLYLHSHLPKSAWLKVFTFFIPRPPLEKGRHTVPHLTRWYLNSSPKPPHKKSLSNFSIRLATLAGIGKRDRKYVGTLDRVLLIKVSLPPFDKYILFQLANLLSIFLITGSHKRGDLAPIPNGRPRYVSGNEAILHPSD